MLLFEGVLVTGAQGHDAAHVDLVEGRQHGGGVLRVLEAPRDGLAQPRHRHALLAILRRWRAPERARHRRGRAAGAARAQWPLRSPIEDIALQDLAALARPFNGGRHRSRDRRRFSRRRARQASRAMARRALAPGMRFCGGAGGGTGLACGSASDLDGAAPAPSPIWPSSAPTPTVSPSLAMISARTPDGRRIDFEGHLVGFEFDDGLVRPYGVAGFLEPAPDGCFSDRFAQGRHADFSCHLSCSKAIRLSLEFVTPEMKASAVSSREDLVHEGLHLRHML